MAAINLSNAEAVVKGDAVTSVQTVYARVKRREPPQQPGIILTALMAGE